jgi:uncharacterized membrane protein YdfJ with MMPL/SSD domain
LTYEPVAVGGDTAAYYDVSTVIGHDMRVIFPLAGLAILLILLLTLQSLLAPLYLMASVVLGFGATGVLLSAFINAFLLVPALTVLAGKAAWWPSRPRVPAHAGRAWPIAQTRHQSGPSNRRHLGAGSDPDGARVQVCRPQQAIHRPPP